MPKKLLLINAILIAIAAGSVVFIARQLMAPMAMPSSGKARPPAAEAERPTEAARASASAYGVVASKNLFSPTRTEAPVSPIASAAANVPKPNLFGVVLPAGSYDLALFGSSVTGITPGLCSQMCTEAIPTAANGSTGNNTSRVSIPAADKLLRQVDQDLDDNVRKSAAREADKILAENAVALPLDPLPDILIWNKKVVGPIVDNPVTGMFWNIDQWGINK